MAKADRGFASMDRDWQRAIASMGGKAAHAKGTAHKWTSDEARAAGRKGGKGGTAKRERQRCAGQERAAIDLTLCLEEGCVRKGLYRKNTSKRGYCGIHRDRATNNRGEASAFYLLRRVGHL